MTSFYLLSVNLWAEGRSQFSVKAAFKHLYKDLLTASWVRWNLDLEGRVEF
jgi:hypothetical protein